VLEITNKVTRPFINEKNTKNIMKKPIKIVRLLNKKLTKKYMEILVWFN